MKFLQKHIGMIVKLALFTLFSIAVRGYQYGSGNQVHYFNFAFHEFYPEFYSQDYLFKIHDLPYTIFVDFIYVILRIFGESAFVFFLIYCFFLFLFYLSIYLITDFFFKNKKISAMMLLFFVFPVPIGGSTIHTFEKSLTPRFIAEVFLLFSMYFLLTKKSILSPVVAGMGFLVHPVTLIPYIPVAALGEVFEHTATHSVKDKMQIFKNALQSVVSKVLIFLLIASPILFKFISGQSEGMFIDEEWRSILHDRLPYLLIWQWSAINFLILFLICAYFAAYEHIFNQKLNAIIKASIFVSLALFSIAFFSSIFSIRLGLQLQLARNLYLLVIFTVVYGMGSFLARLSVSSLQKIAGVALVASVALCFSARAEYGIFWSNPLDEYQKAALWAKNNTATDSLFLVPLDEFGFRFWSKRSVFLEHKEGGDSLYDRSFAMEWSKREKLIEDNQQYGREYVAALKNEYKIDYIVAKQEIPDLSAVYKNNKFFIYKIQ